VGQNQTDDYSIVKVQRSTSVVGLRTRPNLGSYYPAVWYRQYTTYIVALELSSGCFPQCTTYLQYRYMDSFHQKSIDRSMLTRLDQVSRWSIHVPFYRYFLILYAVGFEKGYKLPLDVTFIACLIFYYLRHLKCCNAKMLST
jgi:hypothetical protein